MAVRRVYLALYRQSPSQRAHFAIFVPNAEYDRDTLTQDFRSSRCSGTIIHVVGEPVMAGYALEMKRNYECSTSQDLRKLVLLGNVDTSNAFDPASNTYLKETTPRSTLERQASRVQPPPKGQDIRAPIDGIKTKRCQEWTMEYLRLLAQENLINGQAVNIAQAERDPPTHGIFGYKNAPASGSGSKKS